MVGGCGACEGRYLLVVAHNEEEGGSGIGGCCVSILTLDERRDGSGGGAYGGRVGVDNVGEVALAAFPLHKTVQLSAERTVGDNEVADGSRSAHRLGIKVVQDPIADREGGGMMTVKKGD